LPKSCKVPFVVREGAGKAYSEKEVARDITNPKRGPTLTGFSPMGRLFRIVILCKEGERPVEVHADAKKKGIISYPSEGKKGE